MNKNELIKAFKAEADRVETPDVLQNVLDEARKEGLLNTPAAGAQKQPAVRTKRRRMLFGALGFAACAVLIAAIMLPLALNGFFLPVAPAPSYATVCVKINPSVELTVENGKVTKTRALNKDGAVLLLNLNLTGLDASSACLLLAENAERGKFMTEKGITLVVAGKDEKQLEQQIENSLSAKYNVSVPSDSQDLSQRAAALGVSEGKMRLIDLVRANRPELKEKKLARLDNEDLLEMLEDYDEQAMKDFESLLEKEYATSFDSLIAEVKQLLNGYLADLKSFNALLASTTIDKAEAERRRINALYVKLGEEYELPEIFDLEEYGEELEDKIERAEETLEDVEEDVQDVFEDMFEDWLDDFKDSMKDTDDDDDDD